MQFIGTLLCLLDSSLEETKARLRVFLSEVLVNYLGKSYGGLYCVAYSLQANQRKVIKFFLEKQAFMRWFSVTFLADSAFIVNHAGFEPMTPAL